MHVLILNLTFHPDVAATGQHMWDLARMLDDHGHTVTVVTSRNRHGTNEPLGPAMEKYGRNITVHRAWQTGFGKKNSLARMADFASFYASAFWKSVTVARPDVILGLSSPPMIATMGIVMRNLRRLTLRGKIPVVYHVMDLFPDAAVAMGVLKETSPINRVMHFLTKRTLHASEAVIALGYDMKTRLLRDYGVREDRIHVIQPWADGREVFPIDRDANALRKTQGFGETLLVMYSGNLGQPHDVDTLINAIRDTRDRTDFRWCFSGGGVGMKRLKGVTEREAWPNITFLPYQPRELLNDLINLADVHLVSQLPSFTGLVVPCKMFGIMAAGKPTIMIGEPAAENGRILLETGGGVVIAPGDAAGLIAAIDRYLASADGRAAAGNAARAALDDRYSQQIQCERLEKVLEDVSARR